MTGGLVIEQEHIVLPCISAFTTAVVTVLTMLVGIVICLFNDKNQILFERLIVTVLPNALSQIIVFRSDIVYLGISFSFAFSLFLLS